MRKEAVISSQIEGTQTTLLGLLVFEAGKQARPNADIEEVTNYLAALVYARGQLSSTQFETIHPYLDGNAASAEGDWEGWLDFFLDGVATISDEAVASACDLYGLVSADRTRLLAAQTVSVPALRLFEQLPLQPIVTVASAMKIVDATKPTTTRAIEILRAIGILAETTSRKRDRSFAYRAHLERLQAGTELERQ